jgi:hypothetical protein
MLTYVRTGTAGGIFIQIMQINNKNVYKIHNTYAVLYTQSPLASVGNVLPDEGIGSTADTCPLTKTGK